MKKIRVLAMSLAILVVFTIGAAAIDFVPSIERREGPQLIQGIDEVIVTPLMHVFHASIEVHEDIEESLVRAHEVLSDSTWSELVHDFEDLWKEFTGGAPIENAIVNDIFDARLRSELVDGAVGGKPISFSVKIQDLTKDDKFMIITEPYGEHHWKTLEYTIDDNNEIHFNATSMSSFAVVRDTGENPPISPDDPDSPQTGVRAYLLPAVIGALGFGALAVVCVYKLRRRAV